ncbi:MAG: hypothetical protein ACREVN_09610 [Gammaproteobacteria bacterium]
MAAPVTEERSWTETYAVTAASPRLEVSNLWGSVQVRVGPPGRITASITELRSAPDQARFERSQEVLKLEVEADASGVSFLVGEDSRHRQHWNDCHDCRVDYQFDIEVPPDAVVDVGTVMDGKVDIQGVAGRIRASNVNGPISVADVRNCESVNSVNGPITMGYSHAPLQDCRIETVNGDVTLVMPIETGLDVRLDLFNGEASSELPVSPFELPATVERIVQDGRTRYRIQQMAGMRVGAGGPTYSIASMNGDLRIRKHP